MPQFHRRFIAGLVLAVLTCLSARGQRLALTAHPEHYQLILTPNLKDATFTGNEKIDVVLSGPTNSITLNAAEIKFQTVKRPNWRKAIDRQHYGGCGKAASHL